LDGSEPTIYSQRVWSPLEIRDDRVLRIRSIAEDGTLGTTSTFKFYKGQLDDMVTLTATSPDEPYNAQGVEALRDGLTAQANYTDPAWIGFVGKDVILEFEIQEPRWVNAVGFNTLNSPGDWIIAPFSAQAEYYLRGELVKTQTLEIAPANTLESGDLNMKVEAKLMTDKIRLTLDGGALPQWHDSKGNGAWLFLDEVTLF
ncbi:MAG: hypothetical protein R3Y19_00840, partial [Rikenellaceae bacterium]